jgi:hypothetical protein
VSAGTATQHSRSSNVRVVDLAGQFRKLRRRTEKAGRGFERFRRFLVLPTYRESCNWQDSDREELEEKLKQSRRLAADQPDPVIQGCCSLWSEIWNADFRIDHEAWRLGLSAIQPNGALCIHAANRARSYIKGLNDVAFFVMGRNLVLREA